MDIMATRVLIMNNFVKFNKSNNEIDNRSLICILQFPVVITQGLWKKYVPVCVSV